MGKASSARSNSYRINQSYKHDLNSDQIANSIRGKLHDLFIATQKEEDNENQKNNIPVLSSKTKKATVNIDISSSLIKDEGIETIIESLQSCEEREEPVEIAVSLEARMNHFSSQGVAMLFDSLVSSAEEKMIELNSTTVVGEEHNTTTDTIINEGNEEDTKEDDQKSINVNSTQEVSIENQSTATKPQKKHFVYMESIDLGLNDIGLHGVETYKKASKTALFLKSMKRLIENQSGLACPIVLRMDNCGLGPPSCRMIGKGIINAAQNILSRKDRMEATLPSHFGYNRRLKELYMSGNPISESGTTALAAALKIAPRIQNEPVIETLDISSCDVGDIGAEAISLAIAGSPGCVKYLSMSNNRISDIGAMALARALKASYKKMNGECVINTLDLSNNADIGDDGAVALFDAVECGAVSKLLLRSCSIRAEGASVLGQTIGRMVTSTSTLKKYDDDDDDTNPCDYLIDISGNKLGTMKSKKKPGYSASMMNSMNSIGQKGFGFLKSGLKDIVDFGGSTLESDDEAEEDDDNSIDSEDVQQVSDKCGAILLYDSFMESFNIGENESKSSTRRVNISVGFRMCNFDDDAANAMAAIVTHMNTKDRVSITFDCEMNNGIEQDCIQVLKKQDDINTRTYLLDEMAERHLTALESRKRALEAKEAESRLSGLGLFGEDDTTEDSDHYFFGNDDDDSYNNDFNPYDDYDY